MPVMNDDNSEMQAYNAVGGSRYGFSAKRIASLGASEYTLVDVAVDVSTSVAPFVDRIEACVLEVVKSCCLSPRADNLMLRVTAFNSTMVELHGYKPLSECNPDDYRGRFVASGMTALFDTAQNVIAAQAQYARDLVSNDFSANGIIFIITDGENTSTPSLGIPAVKAALVAAMQGEALESLVTVLIGVNVNEPRMRQYHQDFQTQAGLTQYVPIDDASEKKLAKLAAFVSKSISMQSQALGTGGPSQALSF